MRTPCRTASPGGERDGGRRTPRGTEDAGWGGGGGRGRGGEGRLGVQRMRYVEGVEALAPGSSFARRKDPSTSWGTAGPGGLGPWFVDMDRATRGVRPLSIRRPPPRL